MDSRLRGNDEQSGFRHSREGGNPATSRSRRQPECSTDDVVPKIAPVWICFFDQSDLPSSIPLLDPFLASDRRLHRLVQLEPDQTMDVVARAETVCRGCSMLPDPLHQIRRDTEIQGAVATVCEQLDAWLPVHGACPLP